VKNKYKRKTLLLMDRQLEENMLGPFVYVFFYIGDEGQLRHSYLWKE
jgi:hypothetical protein